MHNSMQMSSSYPRVVTGILSRSCAAGFDVAAAAPLAELLDLEVELGVLDLPSVVMTPSHECRYLSGITQALSAGRIHFISIITLVLRVGLKVLLHARLAHCCRAAHCSILAPYCVSGVELARAGGRSH